MTAFWPKRLIVTGLIVLLAACSNEPGTADIFKRAVPQQLRTSTVSPAFATLMRQGAPAIAVALTERKGASVRFVRQGAAADGIETWITGNNLSLAMQDGMILGSRGLGGDLIAADAGETAALLASGREGVVTRYHAEFGGDNNAKTRAFKCRVSNQGPFKSTTPSGPVDTILMQENCNGIGVSFVNFFWMSPNGGTVVQSRQWLTPTLGYVTTSSI